MPPRYDPVPFDHEEVIVADSAIGLTPATYLDASRAEMTLEGGQIRIWVDGSDPTASDGEPVDDGDIIRLKTESEIANFKAICTSIVSGSLMVQYYH